MSILNIPSDVLDLPVEGVNLAPGTFRDQLGAGRTLLIFLRHFGCIFCRRGVSEVREAAARQPSYPSIVFVYNGSPAAGAAFFDKFAADARAIADPSKRFYKVFEVERGSVRQMIGPAVWSRGFEAWRAGHRAGLPIGDPWQMPGVFLVEGDRVLWSFKAENAADLPRYDEIPNLLVS